MKIFVTVLITCAVTLLVAVPVCIGLMRRHKEDLGVAVLVEKPTRGDLVEVVSASGTIMPKTKVSISARVSALIQEIPHDEGEAVTRGDPSATPPTPSSVLVRLDDKDLAVGAADGGVAAGIEGGADRGRAGAAGGGAEHD